MSGHASTAPTVKDLLAACETALGNGFRGVEAGMCEFYVRPCDCDSGDDSGTPRVCLPEGVASEALARKVIRGIESEPALKTRAAPAAAAVILAGEYPCP